MLKRILLVTIIATLFTVPLRAQTFLKKLTSVGSFAKLGNTLFFAGNDGSTGIELWKTDGTAAGTVLVKDINKVSSTPSSGVSGLFAFNGKVYFSADDGINGIELWTSDGTEAGTLLVKNINTQITGIKGSDPGRFTAFNGALYFTARPNGQSVSLWRTDGTTGGTIKLTDDEYADMGQLTVVGPSLYFTRYGSQDLWKTDGTVAGTKKIITDDYYTVDLLRNIDNELVFIKNTTNRQNIRLYKLNPADDNPVLLQSFDEPLYGDIDIDNITAVGSNLYFEIRSVNQSGQGTDAVWKSNKTPAGTTLVKAYSWSRGSSGSNMEGFIAYNNKLYFSSTVPHKLYTTDGTDAGTIKVSDVILTQGLRPILSDGKIFWGVSGQLWSYNGSVLKKEIDQPTNPQQLSDVNGRLYFTVGNEYSKTLWNNDASPLLSVTRDNQSLQDAGSIAFTSKKDSASVSNMVISNTGNKPLILSEISVTGASFYVSGKSEQTLAPGAQANFKLIYYPSKEEILKGTLNIKSNNGTNVFTVLLTGTATGKARKPSVITDGIAKQILFNDAQPSFTLSNNTIAEDLGAGSSVGSFQVSGTTDPYTYSFIAGTGDTDNSSFTILNGEIKTASALDFEAKSTYTIRVKATGPGNAIEKVFVVKVSDVPEAAVAADCVKSVSRLTSELYDVGYFGNALVAVGSEGIIRSANNGLDWYKVNTGYNQALGRLKITDDHTGYAYGQSSLLKTENSGETWFALDAPNTSSGTIYFYSTNIGFMLGDGGIYKTTDGGKTWKKAIASTNFSQLNSAWFIDASNGFICGSGRTYLKTTDGGDTWQSADLGALGEGTNLVDITFTNANTGYILSSAGDVLQSNDGGNTWRRISIVDEYGRIFFKNETEGYVICGSSVFKTTNGGVSWQKKLQGSVYKSLAISKTSSKYCVVGFFNGIYLNDGTDTWNTRSLIPRNDFLNINFVDDNIGYVFSDAIHKTTDGGVTWQSVMSTGGRIFSSYFINKDVGFYSANNRIYRTTDGGKTWVMADIEDYFQASKFHFINDQVGFIIGDNGKVFKTINSGLTWQNIPHQLPGIYRAWGTQFLDAQIGFLLDGTKIYKTLDGCNTWTTLLLPLNRVYTSIHFLTEDIGLVGDSNGLMVRTTDGGITWSDVVTPTNILIKYFAFTDNLHGYAFANANSGTGALIETFDGGLTWTFVMENSAYFAQVLNNQIFMCSRDGIVYKLSASPNIINAGYISGSTDVYLADKTNYTIPSIPNTSFTWAVSGTADVEYINSGLNVVWKQAGNYTITATPTAACGNGVARIINVVVSEQPKPVITSYYIKGQASLKTITINGNNFTNVIQVKIGGVVLPSFAISSPSSITANLGAVAAGDIEVTNSAGTTLFKYAPPPVITSLSVMAGGANTAITISGQDFNDITDVTFGNVPAKSFTVSSPGSITAVVGGGSSGEVAVTGKYGIATLSGFTFYQKPVLNFISPSSAGPNTTVSIYGSNLNGTTAVSFGGAAAQSFTVNSSNLISAKVPAVAASGSIQVTTAGGTAAISNFVFIPTPVISAASYTTPGLGSITINGNNFNNVTGVSIGGTAATSFTVNSPTSITAVFPTGSTGTINVTTTLGVATYTGKIGKAAQTITFSNIPAATYGDADITLNAISSNSSIPIVYSVDNNDIGIIQSNKLHIVKSGNVTITASQQGNEFYEAADAVKQTLTISKAVLTLIPDNISRQAGEPNPLLKGTANGFVNGENTNNLIKAPVWSTTATAASPAGLYDIVAAGGEAENYEFVYAIGKLNVLPNKAVITFPAIAAHRYGDADIELSATSNNAGVPLKFAVDNPDVVTLVNNKIHILKAGDVKVTVSQEGNGFYEPAESVQQTIVINKATLAITADDKTKVAGKPNPAFTLTYSGFVNGDTPLILTQQPVVATIATTASGAGVYDIVASGAVADNYDVSYNNGKLTVTKDKPVITFPALAARRYGDVDIELTATSTNTGVPLIYSTDKPDIATIINSKIHILKAGSVSVTANQEGNSFYEPAESVQQTLVIDKAALVIIPDDKTRAVGKPDPAFTVTYQGFVKGETSAVLGQPPVITTTATAASVAGIYDIVPSGAVSDNYSFTYNTGKLFITPALDNLKVSATDVTCKGQGNGIIAIIAKQTASYTAVLTGNSINKSYTFTADLNIDNLSPGTYNVCVSDAALPGQKRCFDLTIAEPKDLSVYAAVVKNTSLLNISLAGGNQYQVTLNGRIYSTRNNSITLELTRGSNKLEVATDKDCQGKIEQIINYSGNPVPYPNPFSNELFVNVGVDNVSATIKIYSVTDGSLKLAEQFKNVNGVIKLDVSKLKMGVYSVHVTKGNIESVYKVIKQ